MISRARPRKVGPRGGQAARITVRPFTEELL